MRTHQYRRLIRSLARSADGALGIVFAVVALMIVLAVGAAIDYSRAGRVHTALQASLDAASLAGAKAIADGEENPDAVAQVARAALDSDYDAGLRDRQEIESFAVESDFKTVTVTVKATSRVKTTVLSMLNIDTIALGAESTATVGQASGTVLDAVFCLDTTASMLPTIESVKEHARDFYDDLNAELKKRGVRPFDLIRAKPIAFADLESDGVDTLIPYRFFDMRTEAEAFKQTITDIRMNNGGDTPEHGLDCVSAAMRSEWFASGNSIPDTPLKAHQIYPLVVIWSDAPTKPLFLVKTPVTKLWNDPDIVPQENRMIVHFGVCGTAVDRKSWAEVAKLKGYSCGGSEKDGNAEPIRLLADAIAARVKNATSRLSN